MNAPAPVLSMVEVKRLALVNALRASGGSAAGAAYMLNVSYNSVLRWSKQLDIEPIEWMDKAA